MDIIETIEVIKSVIEPNEFEAIICTKDLNADFLGNSSHLRTVLEAVEEVYL